MKVSNFNITVQIEDGILLYNTNSNGILKLNKEYQEKYNGFLENGVIEDENFKSALLQGQMIVDDNDADEIKGIFIESNIARFSGNSIGLTIAPTMACNFRCPYCYEKGREYTTMSRETIEKTKEFIKNLNNEYKYIDITWYGGEPLLAFPIIEELMETVYENFERKYVSSHAVTNGYLLTEEVVQKMKNLNISSIQITIDGPPEIHNKRRRLPNGEDTFFVILNNLKRALQIYSDLSISIRINTDKSNIQGVDEIVGYLEKYGLLDKVFLYLAPVTNLNETCKESQCFNTPEFAIEEIDFLKRNQERGYSFIGLPMKNIGICGAVSPHSYVLDAKGDFYKCWDDVSDLKEKVGSLYDKNRSMNSNMVKWLSHTIENDDECKACSFLPLCMGGCPNYWIKNKQKNCTTVKENAEQLVRLIYDVTKQRKESRV